MSAQTPTEGLAGTQIITSHIRHTARISARWYWRGVSGSEVLDVEIPKSLAQVIAPHQLQHAGVLRAARMDDAGRIELRIQQDGRPAAREYILRAARMLRLLAYTNLRPATPEEIERTHASLDGMPGYNRAIAAAWVHVDTGAWAVAVNTAEPGIGSRAGWCRENGIAYLAPGWSNVWSPRTVMLPNLLCSDQATATAMAESLDALHAAGRMVWRGTAAKRTTTTADAAPPRPKHSMELERHAEVDEILATICGSPIPPKAAKAIRDARRVLEEWLRKEHPSESDGIYSSRRKSARVIVDRADQMAALARAVSILEGGYRRSKARDALTRDLRRARARLAVSRAPRGQPPERRAA